MKLARILGEPVISSWKNKGQTEVGVKVTRFVFFSVESMENLTFFFKVMWVGCLGGTWEYAGCTNLLGSYVPHVCKISLSWTHRKGSSTSYVKTTTCNFFFSFHIRFSFHSFLFRTALGLKKQLRVYSTKIALSLTHYSSFHSQYGCWVRRIDIWRNSIPART